jgi:hypothetical protein
MTKLPKSSKKINKKWVKEEALFLKMKVLAKTKQQIPVFCAHRFFNWQHKSDKAKGGERGDRKRWGFKNRLWACSGGYRHHNLIPYAYRPQTLRSADYHQAGLWTRFGMANSSQQFFLLKRGLHGCPP